MSPRLLVYPARISFSQVKFQKGGAAKRRCVSPIFGLIFSAYFLHVNFARKCSILKMHFSMMRNKKPRKSLKNNRFRDFSVELVM